MLHSHQRLTHHPSTPYPPADHLTTPPTSPNHINPLASPPSPKLRALHRLASPPKPTFPQERHRLQTLIRLGTPVSVMRLSEERRGIQITYAWEPNCRASAHPSVSPEPPALRPLSREGGKERWKEGRRTIYGQGKTMKR